MKTSSFFIRLLFLFSIFGILSCGSDNNNVSTTASTTNALAPTCSCNTEYSPVCGINTFGETLSYDNICIANCKKVTNIVSGNCVCSESLRVCTVEGDNYSECEARFYRKTIKKYGSCSSASL
jgi:hypothetical protein